jgi:uncharacterized membrane protein (UPF0127 family)
VYERWLAVNKTRSACLASHVEIAETIFQRMKGLIGRTAREFPSGCGLWITPCNGIHTFAMSFPIDAVYLDSRCRVLRLCHGLKPFRIAPLSFKTQSVLELPAGTLAQGNTKVGDVIEFQTGSKPPEDAAQQ